VYINLHKGTKIIHKYRIKRATVGPNRKIRKAKNHHICPRHQNLNRPPKNWKPPLPKKKQLHCRCRETKTPVCSTIHSYKDNGSLFYFSKINTMIKL
jgi:hypothetical protein